jgi:excisionase family DNA binding protein
MTSNSPAKLEEFLTVNQAAAYLGVSASTLRNWDRAKKLKAKRHPINGYRLYRRHELDRVFRSLGARP